LILNKIGQILTKLLSEKYGLILLFIVGILVFNNVMSSSSTSPPPNSCPPGQTLCNTVCVNLMTDPNNCSSCGTQVPANSSCVAGSAVCNENYLFCPPGTSTECVDITTSINCGSCGNDISSIPYAVCVNGSAGCDSSQGYINCPGQDQQSLNCVDGNNDILNCGACNRTSANATCENGVITCTGGFEKCQGTECIIDLQTDVLNCGTCGNILPIFGVSQATCVNGQAFCDNHTFCPAGAAGGCRDIFNDVDNCGECGNIAPPNSFCQNGLVVCEGGFAQCDSDINCSINLLTDVNNCNGCGAAIIVDNGAVDGSNNPVFGECREGIAICTNASLTYCPNQGCRDLLTDPKNCGECYNDILENSTCENGEIICDDGYENCGGLCYDLLTDLNHCGQCDISVPKDGTCENGVIICEGDLENCENSCYDLMTDPNNCGACDSACPINTPQCVAGICVDLTNRLTCGSNAIDCTEGTLYGGNTFGQCCDFQCRNTSNDIEYCGGCTNKCDRGPNGRCIDGVCEYN